MLHKMGGRVCLARTAGVVAAIAAVSACSPDATTPLLPRANNALLSAAGTEPRERQGELARKVAVALSDPALRQRVRNDLRDTPFPEFKLNFTDYLRTASGARLLRRIAEQENSTEAATLQELSNVPALEFYMPVSAHRRTWRGGRDLIVATQVEDTDDPTAWDVHGNRIALSLSAAPATPVLVLVPVETNFDRPLSPQAVASRGNPKRETIEDPSIMLTCGTPDCSGGGGGGGTGYPAGLYITFQRLVNKGEPWTLGAPEIEVHIHGPQSASSPQYGNDLACSGDRVGFPRGFNQDNAFWTGTALLFDQNQINAYNAVQQNGFNISVWEDDNGQCGIKTDFDFANAIRQISTAAGGYAAVTAATGIGPTIVAAGTFIAALYTSLTQLNTKDDFLGTYVSAAKAGFSYTDANHVLLTSPGAVNGRAMIISRGTQ